MNAAKDARANNLTVAEGLSEIGAALLSTREVSSAHRWLSWLSVGL